MKLLFLDSNILLNFYDFHDEDLDQLNILADLIDSSDIKLYLTTQVLHEVRKNRDLRLKESYEKYSNHKFELPMPVFCKTYEEYAEIKKAQKILNLLKSKLSKRISTDIQSRQLKADLIIELLVEKSEIIESEKYLDSAIRRHRLGRPPGKNNKSYGDEINWESLLAEVSEDGDFIIVSQDADFSSAINNVELKDYLHDEWHQAKKSNIFLYKKLTTFFSEHDIKIELQIELEKNSLVESLINSSNFATTHGLVSKLNKYASFNDEQLLGLATALLENNQVHWLSEDADMNNFYKKYFAYKSDKFDTKTWAQITEYIWTENDDSDLKAALDEALEKAEIVEGLKSDDVQF